MGFQDYNYKETNEEIARSHKLHEDIQNISDLILLDDLKSAIEDRIKEVKGEL